MIYGIDLDGVITDFVGAAAKLFNIKDTGWEPGSYDIAKAFNIEPSRFWARINSYEFWSTLPKTDFADDLFNLLQGKEYFIITSPTLDPQSLAGKYQWIKNHYPKLRCKVLVGACKQYCADSNTVLIDDSDEKIQKFISYGGHGILVPQIWNSNHALAGRRLEYMKGWISYYG